MLSAAEMCDARFQAQRFPGDEQVERAKAASPIATASLAVPGTRPAARHGVAQRLQVTNSPCGIRMTRADGETPAPAPA